ncbi:MAG: helix-turn-helix transcriptional regulator [Lachnospiraceae bacterium]|nr:helix-turn-helix transcriptional regulator [Lachnospiraceae bacterium]
MTVYEKLKKLRTEKHFSDKDVAEILGMKLDSYSRLEHGVGKIGSFLKNKLALLYDKDPDYFVDDPEDEAEIEEEPDSEDEVEAEEEAEAEAEPEPEIEAEAEAESEIEAEIEEPEDEPEIEEPEDEPEAEDDREPEPDEPAREQFTDPVEEEQAEPYIEDPADGNEDISQKGQPKNDAPKGEQEEKTGDETLTVQPEIYLMAGEKVKIRVGKRVAEVIVSDRSIAKAKKRGKKIKIKGKRPGAVTVTAFDKNGGELGSLVVIIE